MPLIGSRASLGKPVFHLGTKNRRYVKIARIENARHENALRKLRGMKIARVLKVRQFEK